MRWCIAGAGAMGSAVGVRLLEAGESVVFVARGRHRESMRAHGLRFRDAAGERTIAVEVCADLDQVAQCDVVIAAVKAHQLAPLAADLGRLQASGATLIAMQNGIPWWYFAGRAELSTSTLHSVDPSGILARTLDARATLGCVMYISGSVVEPGFVEHAQGERFVFGRPSGDIEEKTKAIVAAFGRARFDAVASENIRAEVWMKLLGNLNFNPISVLSRATVDEIMDDAGAMEIVRATMREAIDVAGALGDAPSIPVEARIALAPTGTGVKTSMLQDFEAGRRLEIEPLIGSVVELGVRTGIPTPATTQLYALISLLDRTTTTR